MTDTNILDKLRDGRSAANMLRINIREQVLTPEAGAHYVGRILKAFDAMLGADDEAAQSPPRRGPWKPTLIDGGRS